MEQSFLHGVLEGVFTFLPVPFTLQGADIFAALLTFLWGLLGLDFKFVGF